MDYKFFRTLFCYLTKSIFRYFCIEVSDQKTQFGQLRIYFQGLQELIFLHP